MGNIEFNVEMILCIITDLRLRPCLWVGKTVLTSDSTTCQSSSSKSNGACTPFSPAPQFSRGVCFIT